MKHLNKFNDSDAGSRCTELGLMMKYLKLFEGYQSESEVAEICKRFGIEDWSLEGGLVNVDGSVNLSGRGLTEIPLNFGKLAGYFRCDNNNLSTLKGAPHTVGGRFECHNNNLTSLEFCPSSVGASFGIWVFKCDQNNIREFTGLKHIGGDFLCIGNPIFNIWEIINPDNNRWDEEKMNLFGDLDIIQDDGESIVIDRLNFFLEEIGLDPVEEIDGYINI